MSKKCAHFASMSKKFAYFASMSKNFASMSKNFASMSKNFASMSKFCANFASMSATFWARMCDTFTLQSVARRFMLLHSTSLRLRYNANVLISAIKIIYQQYKYKYNNISAIQIQI